MRKNKFLLVVLAIILMFSLVACNNQENLNDNNNIEKENEDVGDNMENDVVLPDENQPDNTENEDKFKNILISKTWQCYKVTDMSANEVRMQEVFGSGYGEGAGSLVFNTDGTFKHIMPGITSDEASTAGTYSLIGIVVSLNYDDGNWVDGRLYVGESESEIELINQLDGYRMYFHQTVEK